MSCSDLQEAMPQLGLTILPLSQAAVRDDKFKLIQLTNENCSATSASGDDTTSELQFYEINERPLIPRIDFPQMNLITNPSDPTSGMSKERAAAFLDLKRELFDILGSEPECPGDGNLDGKVNELDIDYWQKFQNKGSSWYDFNLPITDGYDALTNHFDRDFIIENLGRTCPPR